MSSILTNNSAMVALQTLQSINKNLAMTQNEISTGKSIASAKDNSSIWAISQVMQSDVDGFAAISDSLSLGESTVAVGRQAAESVTDILGQIKEKIVAAQEDNVDRTKLQDDLVSLRQQINGIVSAAQFNGQNLLSNASSVEGSGTVSVLASLDRAADGSVTSSNIDIQKQDLRTAAQSVDAAGTYAAGSATTLSNTQTGSIAIGTPVTGTAYSLSFVGTDADASSFTPATYTEDNSSNTLAAASDLVYVAREGDTAQTVGEALAAAYTTYAAANGLDTDALSITANAGGLALSSNVTTAGDTIAVRVDTVTSASNTVGGGLEALGTMDISTETGADAALAEIENLIQTAIDAAAEFGTGEKRLEIQNEFINKLSDSMKSGIGSLVDADMEAASARLQALQVQQQLGIQSLSIANQAPQNILSLFR
ncbi:MAG: flagellin [Pseudomonadota bacterium]